MKKTLALIITVLLLLTMASCGQRSEETTPAVTVPEATAAPETTAPAETTEPTIPAPTEPEWETGILRANYGEAVYAIFDAGTELNVLGKFKNYYVVEQEDVNLLISMDMLRMEGEAPFESWVGYAVFGMEVFDNPYLKGEPIATLDLNTKVTLLEGKGNWAYIEWDEGTGYIKADMPSKWRINESSPNDGTDVPVGSLTSSLDSDAPRIHLLGAYYGPEMDTSFTGGMATVLADKTEGYICLLNRDAEVKVTSADENTARIWLGDELYAELPRWLLNMEGDAPYESWTGYVKKNGVIYEEYQMATEMTKPAINKKVTVLDEVNGCYVVEFEGQIGYMDMDRVSETYITGGSGNESTWTPPRL